MNPGNLMEIMLLLSAASSGICLLLRSPEYILAFIRAGTLCTGAIAFIAVHMVFNGGPLYSWGGRFYLDALSAFHLMVMMIVFLMSSFYAKNYFKKEIIEGQFNTKTAQRFGSLWFASFAAMILILVSNDLGLMWVGMESTTLATAFLICIFKKKAALEAMWKYLIVCSVGVAFAFMGTLIVAVAAHETGIEASKILFWTNLRFEAMSLDPALMKMGFIFILVGYGTKAGLAPMHTWLPDAHSQAPTPVSAMFSGFMLNASLYCILRYFSLVNLVFGTGNFSHDLLVLFGVSSILISSSFIIFQQDIKRMLAYHSVEHLGIIALGFGLGPAGIFAALFHTINHSICKTLGFFCAGRLGQIYGTHDMGKITGTIHSSPLWGGGLFGSILALVGVVPFALFMSELQILKAAVERGAYVPFVLFLTGAGIVFVGAVRHGISMAWGSPPVLDEPLHRTTAVDKGIVIGSLALLLMLGLWMPDGLSDMIEQAASIVEAYE